MATSWRSRRSLLLKSVLKTVSAGLQRDRLGRLTEAGGGHANLLPNCILKMLHVKQTLNSGGLGKETHSSGMALLLIKWAVGDDKLGFRIQQIKEIWEIGEKEQNLTVGRWK